jgi:hypothetical protein
VSPCRWSGPKGAVHEPLRRAPAASCGPSAAGRRRTAHPRSAAPHRCRVHLGNRRPRMHPGPVAPRRQVMEPWRRPTSRARPGRRRRRRPPINRPSTAVRRQGVTRPECRRGAPPSARRRPRGRRVLRHQVPDRYPVPPVPRSHGRWAIRATRTSRRLEERRRASA